MVDLRRQTVARWVLERLFLKELCVFKSKEPSPRFYIEKFQVLAFIFFVEKFSSS